MKTMILTILSGLSMILAGCVTDGVDKAIDNAAQTAVNSANVNLPEYPTYCEQRMGRADPKIGEPVWATQERWLILRSNNNEQIDWCARWYRQQVRDPFSSGGSTK